MIPAPPSGLLLSLKKTGKIPKWQKLEYGPHCSWNGCLLAELVVLLGVKLQLTGTAVGSWRTPDPRLGCTRLWGSEAPPAGATQVSQTFGSEPAGSQNRFKWTRPFCSRLRGSAGCRVGQGA